MLILSVNKNNHKGQKLSAHESPELIIVIPAYNEEGCLEKVLREWTNGVQKLNLNFILFVVNDGSTDKTELILQMVSAEIPQVKFVTQVNAGHGVALRKGYDWAIQQQAQWIFHVDSDDQFKFDDFPGIWKDRNASPAHFGHRLNRNDPKHRIIISSFLRKILFFIFGVSIPDANIPYRLMHRNFLSSALRHIPSDIFAPNIFISLFAFSYKGRIPVYPVCHIERQTGVVSLPSFRLIKACMRTFWELIKFRVKFKSSFESIDWTLDAKDEKEVMNNVI